MKSSVLRNANNLLEHSEEHLPTEVAECWTLVRVNAQTVRPDLHTPRLPGRLPAEDGLHRAAVVQVTARADHLQDVGAGVIVQEQQQSVNQARYSMLGKLLVDVGSNELLDVDEGEVGVLHTQSLAVQADLEVESDVSHPPPVSSLCNAGNIFYDFSS